VAVAEAANGNGLFDRISRSNRRESMLALRAFVGVDLRQPPSTPVSRMGQRSSSMMVGGAPRPGPHSHGTLVMSTSS
jgi:hypothetical protein